MSLFKLWSYKETNFSAGGLKPSRKLMNAENTIFKSPKFIAPRKLDFRDMCIQTSNQGLTPHCAGYATAGLIEVYNWKRLHYPEQVNGDAIYDAAKLIDKDTTDGTSLDCAAQGAMNLGLISGQIKFIANNIDDIKFAIHTNTVFTGGFLITNEWNSVNKNTGEIADFGDKANDIGGHAILICGYNEIGLFIQNSWDLTWGIYGFALIPWNKVSKQFMYGVVIV